MQTDSEPPTTDEATLAPPRRAAVAFIFITVMLDMLAVGMIVPVLPTLVKGFVDGDTARAASVLGVFGTVWAVMQFLFMPVLGALSDAYGRRPIVLLSNFGLGIDYLLMALAPSLPYSLHVLFIGRVLSGITAASVSTASAYIADVTPPDRRAAAFGLLGAAFGVGFIVGPAVGGLLGQYGPTVPFWVAAGLSLSNGLYGLLVLPESLPRRLRSPFTWRKASPGGSLAILRSRPGLFGQAMVQFLSFLSFGVLPAVSAIYVLHRYAWKERDIGLMLASVGICSLVVQVGLVRPVVARFGERKALLAGLACGAMAFAIYGVAPTGGIFLLGVPVMALRGLSAASSQSLISRFVGPADQGRLQGAVSALQGMAGIGAPVLFSGSFSLAIGGWESLLHPGTPFFIATVLVLISIVVAEYATRQPPEAQVLPAAGR